MTGRGRRGDRIHSGQPLDHGPAKEDPEHAQQVVVAARAALSRLQEVIDQCTVDLLEAAGPAGGEIAVEEAQLVSLRAVLAVQGPLVFHEAADGVRQRALQGRDRHSSSPSPQATSRRAARSTFAYMAVESVERCPT